MCKTGVLNVLFMCDHMTLMDLSHAILSYTLWFLTLVFLLLGYNLPVCRQQCVVAPVQPLHLSIRERWRKGGRKTVRSEGQSVCCDLVSVIYVIYTPWLHPWNPAIRLLKQEQHSDNTNSYCNVGGGSLTLYHPDESYMRLTTVGSLLSNRLSP